MSHGEGVDELVSMQLNVGVLLVRPNGQVALPHSMCATPPAGETSLAALKEFISRLKKEPLLLKAYTAQAIVSIQERFNEPDVTPVAEAAGFSAIGIEEYFSDLSKLGHSSLRNVRRRSRSSAQTPSPPAPEPAPSPDLP